MAALCGGRRTGAPGGVSAAAAGADALPMDEPLLAALAARRALLLTWRCWFLALGHVAARRRAEAGALLGRAEERAASAVLALQAAAAAASEPLPPVAVPVSSVDESTGSAAVAVAADGGAVGGGGGAVGHISHVLAGVSAADAQALAGLQQSLAERRLALQAEALLEATLAPQLRADAEVRSAYHRYLLAPQQAAPTAAGVPQLPATLTQGAAVSLAERLDPRRALACAPVMGEGGSSSGGGAPLLAGSGTSAGAGGGTAPGIGSLLSPLPLPLKPIVLDAAFGAGVAYPDLGPLLPASAKAASPPAPSQAASAPAPAGGAASSAPAPAPAGGLLGWLTGR